MQKLEKNRAIIVFGLGFGDEGKGATVDYIAREQNSDLVVKYNGGAQCAHNVVLPNGTKHTFAQFGSATLIDDSRRTYLGEKFVIHPIGLVNEADALQNLGHKNIKKVVFVSPYCKIITKYQTITNRIKEKARGSNAHGSTGIGFGETVEDDEYSITINDLVKDPITKIKILKEKKEQETYKIHPRFKKFKYSPEEILKDIETMLEYITISKNLPESENPVIFEGGQGVLLDEYYGFNPHTTWSSCVPVYANRMALLNKLQPYYVGCIRAFTTRHGNGPFPTYDESLNYSDDETNKEEEFQGKFKYGHLDLVLFQYAINICALHSINLNAISISCIDRLKKQEHKICWGYKIGENVITRLSEIPRFKRDKMMMGKITPKYNTAHISTVPYQIIKRCGAIDFVILGEGPTHKDRRILDRRDGS